MMTNQAPENGSGRELRSSLEIMGCTQPNNCINFGPGPGVGATLSRPPSRMPDFNFVTHDDAPLSPETQIIEQSSQDDGQGAGTKQFIQFTMSVSLLAFSLLSITAMGAVMTVLREISKPVPVGYSAWLIVSIAVFVFSLAGLGHVLYGSPKVLTRTRLPSLPPIFCWTLNWPSFQWPVIRFPTIRRQSAAQSPSHLPDPKQFELDDLERQPRRPPTPYPGPARPVPIITPQSSLKDSRYQTLPLGFPVPQSSRVNHMSSRVSGMSRVSFQSAPRSVSPLSESPPTPPPKEQAVSRFQSREPLLPPVASGEPVAQSETRASILTELCDAVEVSNPRDELGAAAENYSPLATASSPTGTTGRDSGSIQSPQPIYPIELASPSRGREYED